MQSEEDKRRAALLQQQNLPFFMQPSKEAYQLIPGGIRPVLDIKTKVVSAPVQVSPTVQQPKVVSAPTAQPSAPAPIIKQPSALPFFMQPSKEAYQLIPGGIRPVVDIKMPTTPTAFEKPIAESLQQNLQKVTEAQNLYRQNKISSEALTQLTRNFINEYNTSRKNQEAINLLDKPINTFIENYNTMSDPEQRGIRNKLQDVITSFNAARTPELKQKADTAAYYLNVLTTPKSELLKKASEQEKPIIEALPEAKAKQSFLGTVKDITKSVFLSPANLAQRVSISGQAALGKNLFAQNEADLAAGRISQTEFDRRQSEINAKIAEISGSLTGEDKGLFDRILRSVGTGAEVATYLLPGGGVLRGVRAAEGKLPSTILKQAALGTGVGATSALARTGVDTQPTEIVAAGLLGGVFQGAVPAIAALTTRTIARIKEKPFEQLQQSEKDLLQKEGEFHPQDPNAPVAAQQAPGATQPPKTATTAPEAAQAAGGPAAYMTPEQVSADAQRRSDEIVNRYKVSPFRTAINKVKAFISPDYVAAESDRLVSKLAKKIGETFKSGERLVALATGARAAFNIGQRFIKKGNIGKVLAKYNSTPEQIANFNLYSIFKHDIERIDDGRAPKDVYYNEQTKRDYVAQFEKNNPTAANDLEAISKDLRVVQDMVSTGPDAFVNRADVLAAQTKKDGSMYKYWTITGEAKPENVQRARISGFKIGGVGRQTALSAKSAEGKPFDLTFNTIENWVANQFVGLAKSRVDKEILKRVEQGMIAGAKIMITSEGSARLKRYKESLRELNNIIKTFEKPLIKVKEKVSQAGREFKKAQNAAISRAKKILKDNIENDGSPEAQGALAAIDNMTREDLIAIFKIWSEPDIKLTPNTQKLSNALKSKGENYYNLVNKLTELKLDKQSLEDAKAGIKRTIVQIEQNSDPTGLQTIIGMNENGDKFRIELPPEWARFVNGLDSGQIDAGFKFLRNLQSPIRQSLVGILNPAFQLSTGIWNLIYVPIKSAEGLRIYSKSAVKAGLTSLFKTSEFVEKLQANGAISFGGDLTMLTSDNVVNAIAAQTNNISKLKWYTELEQGKGFRRSWKKLNELGGRIDGAFRAAAATSAYNRARKMNMSEADAIQEAVVAWNNALPDYSNVSRAVKSIDAIFPFVAPGVAGTRDLLRTIKDNPGKMAAKLSILTTGILSIYGYNLSENNKAGQKFYQDMIDSGKNYVLDNNLIIVLPFATKDDKTGEWSGVWKIPLTPEFRSINTAVRAGLLENDWGAKIGTIGLSIGDFLTGKVRDSSSPALQISAALTTGKDPRTGRDIFDQTMTEEEKNVARMNYVKKSLGLPGAMTNGDAWNTFVDSFVNRVYGAKGATPGSIFYQSINDTLKEVPLNKRQLNLLYSAVIPPSKDLLGRDIKSRQPIDTVLKYAAFLDATKPDGMSDIWRFMVRVNEKGVKRGLESNPLYELPPEKAIIIANSNTFLEKNPFGLNSYKLQNPWLQDFYDKSSAYFDKIMAKKTDEERKALGIDVFGFEIPKATPDMQKKLNEVQRLTEAEAKNKDNPTLAGFYKQQRNQFYADNPDITEFYQKQEDYKRLQDAALRLPLLDMYPRLTPELKAIQDEYNALPKGNGPLKKDGTPSSPDRSNWIKNNPEKWGKLTTQWTLQDIYNLQKEGGNAMYEGVDFTDKGLKAIRDIAGVMGMSTTAAGNMWANFQPQDRIYLGNFIAGIKGVDKLPEIKFKTKPTSLLGEVKQYKVKLPEPTRQKARIKLQ